MSTYSAGLSIMERIKKALYPGGDPEEYKGQMIKDLAKDYVEHEKLKEAHKKATSWKEEMTLKTSPIEVYRTKIEDFRGGLKTLASEPNFSITLRSSTKPEPEVDYFGVSESDAIKEKEKSLAKAMEDLILSRRVSSSGPVWGSGGAGGPGGAVGPSGGAGMTGWVGSSWTTTGTSASDLADFYKKHGINIYGAPYGGELPSTLNGECVIPGCHKKADKHEDYGDFICEGHYATYKDSSRVETK